ncbi:ATP-binding cassette domain-containing protein [Suipraeoptans intestinalis]|uniref:ATP-binding cassette domain-containing protein n=1 Tax=Suipraeoptans intestinalis TaxID=2606628 RepID=UPI003A7F50B4
MSFQAKEGEIYGLLGPNGAGKTTTLRCIATLIPPTERRDLCEWIRGAEGAQESQDADWISDQ